MAIAVRWSEMVWTARPPTELATVVFFDPSDDLDGRAGDWGHRLERHDLAGIARFAAALADTEASAWEDDHPDVATRAYDTRRRLVGERIIHWAVPWLDAVGSGYPEHPADAKHDRDLLLHIGDEMRVAPEASRAEGLVVPEQDSFGPVSVDVPLNELLLSLWSGLVLFDDTSEPLADRYVTAERRWRDLAEQHPGSAALWLDLAARAHGTARALA
jgi:hypothetical protein